jgi:hypothetical protein
MPVQLCARLRQDSGIRACEVGGDSSAVNETFGVCGIRDVNGKVRDIVLKTQKNELIVLG